MPWITTCPRIFRPSYGSGLTYNIVNITVVVALAIAMIFVIPSVHSILCSVFVRGAGKGMPGRGLPIFESMVKQV